MARHVRASAHGALVALLASLVVAISGSPAHAVDYDCSDFGSQRAAQLFFLRHGGPSRDPHRLDAEGDGIACESNPAPYYLKRHLPPPPPIRSTVGLSTSREAGIAGEHLTLKVRVTPHLRRTVVLQRKVGSGWDRLASRTTSSRGRLSYDTRVRASTATYRAVLARKKAGHKRWTGDVSRERRVENRRQSVELTLRSPVLVGDTVKARADASPVRPGRRVELQRRERRRWVEVDSDRESRRGRAVFRISAGKSRTDIYRAVVVAAGGASSVASDRERLEFQAPEPDDTTPPDVPTGLAALPGDGEVTLSWSAVADATEYVVFLKGAGRAWTEAARRVDESATVGGLVNGITYRLVVTAVDLAGNESARSAVVTATPVAPDTTPPPVPTGLSARAGDREVAVSWDPVSAPDLADYLVYHRVAGEDAWSSFDHTAGAHQTVGGLANGVTYEFAVASVDSVGNVSGRSASVSERPVAPPLTPPTDVAAEPGDGEVRLTWTASSDPRTIGYHVEVQETSGTWSVVPNSVTTGTAATVHDLTNGDSYTFAVVAVAADGNESPRSQSVTSTPVPATP